MVHLVDCTLNFGPLNAVNCFQFEEMNRKLSNFIHGYDLIGEELLKIFTTAQCLNRFKPNISNRPLADFISSRLKFKSSNRKRQSCKSTKVALKGKPKECYDKEILKEFNAKTNSMASVVSLFDKLEINSIAYTSNSKVTKRNDSAFKTLDGKLGIIRGFFKHEESVLVLADLVVPLSNPFYSPSFLDLKSKLAICHFSKQPFIVDASKISKIVALQIGQSQYISNFSISHLFS
jgi:hypothetical protein